MRNFFDNQDNNDGYPIPDPTDQESDQDSISSAQAAPEDAVPQKQSLSDLMVTPADLDNARAEKTKLALIGAIGNNLSNRQSFGNFFLGKMAPQNDNSQLTKQMMDNADAPIEQKKTLLAQEVERPAIQRLQAMQDPNSDESKTAQDLGQAMIKNIADNGVMNPNSPEFQRLSKMLSTGNAYQIQNGIAQSKFLTDLSLQAAAAKKAQVANEAFATRLASMQGNRNDIQAQRAVNGDKILNTYIPRLDGAQKINNLIDAASKGDVKSNQALLGQLNNEIGRLETGSQSPGLGMAEKTEMNDARAKYQNVLDTLTGKVTNVDLGDKFSAAKSMINDLGKSYYDQIGNRMDMLKAGSMPDQIPVFEAKRNQLMSAYKGFAPTQDAPQGGAQGYSLIPSANADSGMVSVISPEGKTGKIPATKLGEALKRGFKRNGS